MKKVFFLLFPLFIAAQDVPIGNWKDYQSYNSARYIAEANNKIYCVTSGGLFYLDKSENTINRLSKVNGLSDIDVKQIACDNISNTIIIVYENCNIDLIKGSSIINISDIKRKDIVGKKSINNITVKDEIAYLSCSFGLVLLDIYKEEIKDTYKIGANGNFVEITGCAFKQDTIFSATSNGIYFADINSEVLFDYTSWGIYSSYVGSFDNIVCSSDKILVDSSDVIISISFSENTFLAVSDDTIYLNNSTLSSEAYITHNLISNAKYAYKDVLGDIWVADDQYGLLKFSDFEYQERFVPSGPKSNDIYSLEFLEGELFVCHGGHYNFGLNYLNKSGVSIMKNNQEWKNKDYYGLGWAWDILEVASNNGYQYYASWYNGIPMTKTAGESYNYVKQYGHANTEGVLDTTYYSNNRIRVSDLKFDSNGNMWGLSSEVNHPLFVKTNNEEWYSFNMNQGLVDLFFDDLLIDAFGQKWGIIGRGGGVFVYNDNNTLDNPIDDQYKILTTKSGNGNLPSLHTYAIVEDLNGEIWLGTNKGIAVFYNPSAVFSGYNFDAQQILIQQGNYGQYLLSEETVRCIAVDGANRKWIGTQESGVFLISDDGIDQLLHFTTDNSPIFSNEILDITINQDNGEVFIGTSKGLLSYRSDATHGDSIQSNTHVFPNPVRESYYGPIAISGLVANANIKITDIDGNLVFEDFAKGGQAIWNGENKNKERVSTGVYLVFSSDSNGIEKMISKILVIK